MYELWVFLHLICVVAGIGGVVLNGLYAAQAQKAGAEGIAVSEANFAVSHIAEYFIYGIPVFGVLAVFANDGYEFEQTWIWLSIVLYVVAIGISHSLVIPSHRKINQLGRKLANGEGGDAEIAEIQALGKKLAPGGMVLDLLAIVLIALMVWKPGL